MSDLWTVGGAQADEAPVVEPEVSAAAGVEIGSDEQTPPGLPFEFMGQVFHLRPVLDYQWQLLVWADIATQGNAAKAIQQNAATLQLIRAALVDGEWPRFAALAADRRAQTVRDLMPVVVTIHTGATTLPTVPPSDSSGGRPATPVSSGDALSSRVIDREEQGGRPDRALQVALAAEAQAAAGPSAG